MKIEMSKEIDFDKQTFQESTWYMVSVGGIHKAFRIESEAKAYYDAVIAFHAKYGTIESVKEILFSEEIEETENPSSI